MSSEPGDPEFDPERRERGLAWMRRVYGWDVETVDTPYVRATVDHLFADVWDQGELSVRDRRLLLLGLTAGSGLEDVAGLQAGAALSMGELSPGDLRTIVVFLAHYAGSPRAARLNTEIEKVIARAEKKQSGV